MIRWICTNRHWSFSSNYNMRCFGIFVVFGCAFGVITGTVEVEDAQSQTKESETIDNGLDIRHEEQSDFKGSESTNEFEVNSNDFPVESDTKTNDSSDEHEDSNTQNNNSSFEVDRNTSSEETDTSDSSNKVENNDSSVEVDTNMSSEVIDTKASESINQVDMKVSEDKVDTTTPSKEKDTSSNEDEKNGSSAELDTSSSPDEIDTKTGDSSIEVDTSSTTSEEVDRKTDTFPIDVATNDPSEQLKVTTNSPVIVTDNNFLSQKVLGMNIGLYFVLEELRRRITYNGRVPTELVIKVMILSSKIEQAGGDIIPLNRNMMKIIPDILPTFFKDAVCSPV